MSGCYTRYRSCRFVFCVGQHVYSLWGPGEAFVRCHAYPRHTNFVPFLRVTTSLDLQIAIQERRHPRSSATSTNILRPLAAIKTHKLCLGIALHIQECGSDLGRTPGWESRWHCNQRWSSPIIRFVTADSESLDHFPREIWERFDRESSTIGLKSLPLRYRWYHARVRQSTARNLHSISDLS